MRFTTAAALVNELVEARAANTLSRALGRWERIELIGIDDIQITGQPGTAGGETPNGALTMAVANPVRGATQVRFSTETAQNVRLAVYDVLGRRVATLADGVVSGTQTATLNTAGLAPGVYVVRMTAGAFAATQRMTVVR